MEVIEHEQVLLEKLSNCSRKRYRVVDFCEDAAISRRLFYLRYHNMSDMFTEVLKIQIRRTLRSNSGESITQMFFRMLEKIKKNKIFYANIRLISKDPRIFYHNLRKEYAQAIENYLRPRGAFSVTQVEMVANGIYAIIDNWVLHECEHPIVDVFQSIRILLDDLTRKINRNK
ncbi:hypothetical protein [Lactobacillus xylocopicola]|uniref:Transcriptional regulator TetR C-terminal Firmicutes type domain-containing protein n=1 Tax=Lactobacillus xylocopicola TaxID=2976676 RepID=A0ABN6SK98_9LACO|nr:hypothetical protein [Lactobacillus xylocopicola]BDR60788.1 hypothetical protein KIM322_10490 [Lactobacillus xylocopicola]